MKRSFLLFLPFLLFVAGAFVACEEVTEEGKYDNWQQRNEAFIDSIKVETGEHFVITLADADKVQLGELFAIPVQTEGTNQGNQYVYCKKLVKNETGDRPLYTGYHSIVSAYYYGTLINGSKFDGNFDGYGALDQKISLPLSDSSKWPTKFNSPSTFSVKGVIAGWTQVLQYMRTGERWLVYIPWRSAYGAGGNGSIPGYTTLTFDMILDSIVE